MVWQKATSGVGGGSIRSGGVGHHSKMVMAPFTYIRQNALSLTAGALLGSFLIGGPMMDMALSEWDQSHPVWVKSRVQVRSQAPGELIVDIWGTKVRACDQRRITAFAATPTEPYVQLSINRLDRPMTGSTRPLGTQHVGTYKLTVTPPVPYEALIVNENECAGRLVQSTLAKVEMRGQP
jgi:hypothetical protein